MRKIQLKKVVKTFLLVFLLLLLSGVATYKIMNSRKFQFFGGIIEGLKSKGYEFKTVNELLAGSKN